MGTPVTFSKTQCRGTGVTVDMQVSPVWVGGPCHRLWHPLPQSFELAHSVSMCTLHNFALQESGELSPPSWYLRVHPTQQFTLQWSGELLLP